MGNYEDAPRQPAELPRPRPYGSGASVSLTSSNIIAAAFSAAFERPVVTSAEYEQRKHEPQFAQVETLDLDKVAELSFEPVIGKFGDVYGESGDKIAVCLKTPTGRKIQLQVGSDSYVEEVKYLLEKHEGIPVDNDRLVLLYRNTVMPEGSRISDYGVVDRSTIDFTVTLRASGPRTPLILSDSVLDSGYDYDYSSVSDGDEMHFYRGGKRYYRPCGWKRTALKVHGKYENDIWLGTGGIRTESSSGEWPVSYHGTKNEATDSIAKQGYLLSKGNRFVYGKGIYSSPSIDVAARYATSFEHNNVSYRVVFQNRVSPDGLKIVDRTGDTAPYWIQSDEKLIRPYGLCIQEY